MSVNTYYGPSKVYLKHPPDYRTGALIMLVPGQSEGVTHGKALVDRLAELDFTVFTFNPPTRRLTEGYSPPDPITRQAKVLHAVGDRFIMAKTETHGVGHALGGAALLKAVQLPPENRFSSLVLFDPVGINESQTLGEVTKRAANKLVGHYSQSTGVGHSGRIALAHLASGSTIARRPRLAAMEAAASGQYDILEDLAIAKDMNVPVHVVVSEHAELFDPDRIAWAQEKITPLVESLTVLDSPEHGHDSFWVNPEFTAQLISLLISQSQV